MDSFAVRTLRDIAHMARLRGAETVIVGIQPEVAFAMVQLGLTLKGVSTALDLEEGLAFLDRQGRGRPQRGPGRGTRGGTTRGRRGAGRDHGRRRRRERP